MSDNYSCSGWVQVTDWYKIREHYDHPCGDLMIGLLAHGCEQLIDVDDALKLAKGLNQAASNCLATKTSTNAQHAQLCYVEDGKAFFTTCPLDKQWGDDWNDAPCEHNAGRPYVWHPKRDEDLKQYQIYTVVFDRWALARPCDSHLNSPYSVEMINKKAVPWLLGEGIAIWAGATVQEFIETLKKCNIQVSDVKEFE